MEYNTALQRVGEYTEKGDSARARCPAHNGTKKTSLQIRNDNGVAYFTCFSRGCNYKDILSALGEEERVPTPAPTYSNGQPPPPDMSEKGQLVNAPKQQPRPKEKVNWEETARYEYENEVGAYLFHKVRMEDPAGNEPKTFRARRGDDWKIGDVRIVLYNLPAVIKSPIVFIVEGEKDVDRLMGEGIVATTNFDGASMSNQKPKWLDSYNPFFKDKTVYILPDNDEQGLGHSIHINKQLHKIAESCKIVELTKGMGKGADVSDWLDDGHTIDELLEIVTAPPSIETVSGIPPMIAGPDLFDKHFPPFEFVVGDMFALGHLFMLGGRPKSGKSWLMLQMAAAVDQRRAFLGRVTRPSKILYIALEDGERRINQRMKILKWRPSENIDFMFQILPLSTGGDGHPGLEQLEKLTPFYDLIVIDTLIATLNGKTNENDNVHMGNVMNGLATMAHDTNTAIALVHHTGKGKRDDPFEGFRGASAIRGAYDIGAILIREVGEDEAILHLESRDFDIEDMTLRQSKEGAGWESLGGKNVMKDIKAGKRVVEYMEDYGDGFTTRQFSDTVDIAYQTASKMLKTAVTNGILTVRDIRPNDKGRGVATYFGHGAYGSIPL